MTSFDTLYRCAEIFGYVGGPAGLFYVGRKVAQVIGRLKRLSMNEATLTEIALEFKPNGGSRLKDVIDQIKNTTMAQDVVLAQQNTVLQQQNVVLDRHGILLKEIQEIVTKLGEPIQEK